MKKNINTREYWDKRFSTGDWIRKNGRKQTEDFVSAIVKKISLSHNFDGTILDFGCGLGDGIPVLHKSFPFAQLVGCDISESAISQCKEFYGGIATFYQGDYIDVKPVDVIICSNVLEHLDNDIDVAKSLRHKCKILYIAVPYKERPLIEEHVNAYDEFSFKDVGEYTYDVFTCKGWTQFGIRGLWWNMYFKNIFRYILGFNLHYRNKQIIFKIKGTTG
jgi:SAM-dependent methyltransferase